MACSKRSNRSSDGGERAKSYAGATKEKKRGESREVFCLVNFSPPLHNLNAWSRLGEGGGGGVGVQIPHM